MSGLAIGAAGKDYNKFFVKYVLATIFLRFAHATKTKIKGTVRQ